MKNKSLKVVIADPCHENWDAMSPTDQGRFCSSCSKPVIDFSSMSDLRLTEFLREKKGQHMCGRFTEGQLNRKLMNPLPAQKTYHLRAVLLGATLTSVFGLESCKSSSRTMGAYAVCEVPKEETALTTKHSLNSVGKKNSVIVSGMVMEDGSNIGLSDSKIVVYSTDRKVLSSTKSKKDGSFKLNVNLDKKPSYIMVYSSGYMDQMVGLRDLEKMQNLVVSMRAHEIMMKGDVMIIEE
jgi:hypothetical protein